MECLWQPLNRTMELPHNINFPKWDGPSIQILQRKSVIFDVVLLSPNQVPGQPTINNAMKDTTKDAMVMAYHTVISSCCPFIGKSFPYISCLALHGLHEESMPS